VESRESKGKELVKIDLSNVMTSKELHNLLKNCLDFPSYYGRNWAAFWDAITGLVELPLQIEFVGWSSLENNLPIDAKNLKELLNDYNELVYVKKRTILFN
jgi:ribonuclease inhibitor